MNLILLSIGIRLLAMAWSVLAAIRQRDWRLLVMAVMLGLMASRQILTLTTITEARAVGLSELPGFAVSVLALLAVVFVAKALGERKRSVESLRQLNLAGKDAQEQLRESEAMSRAILDSMPAHVAVLDQEGSVIAVNQAWERFGRANGHQPGEDLGRNYLEICRQATEGEGRFGREAAAGIDAVLRGKRGEFEMEYPCIGPHHRQWFLLHATPLQGGRGTVVAHTDITRRAQAAEAVRQSEERFRQLAENIREVFWLTDWKDRRVLYISPAFEAIWGADCQSVYDDPKSWLRMIHPDDRSRVESAIDQFEQCGYEEEYRIVRSDGDVRWVHDRAFPIHDANGAVTRVAGIAEDITDRRQAEEEIRRRRNHFEQLAVASPAIVFQTNERGETVYVNQRWEQLTGRPEGSWRGDGWLQAVHPEDRPRVAEQWTQAVERGEIYRGEFRLVHTSGEVVWCLSQAVPLGDGAGEGYVGTAADITQLKQAEARQRLMMRELDHRVRNNLSALEGLIGLTAETSSEVAGFAEAIQHRVHAMAKVHEMLGGSRWSPVPLRKMVQGLLPPQSPGGFVAEGPTLLIPPGQATALGMLIHELMINGLKHGALGATTGRVTMQWKLQQTDGGQRCELRWRESGGPPIAAQPTSGVGSTLIEGLVHSDLRGELELSYPPGGVDHRFTFAFDGREDTSGVDPGALVRESEHPGHLPSRVR